MTDLSVRARPEREPINQNLSAGRALLDLGQTPLRLGPRPLQHTPQRDGHAGPALALVGGLHEGEQLQRLLGADRRPACAEELADLLDQRRVPAVAAARDNALR